MIAKICQAFRSTVDFSIHDEVDHFRALSIALKKFANAIFIEEAHGQICQVEFQSLRGNTEQCEIADLLIISVLPTGVLKATFWQAKKTKLVKKTKQPHSKWLVGSTGNEQLDFDGQFNQWELLAKRPTINALGNFHAPPDLLKSFDSPSIGSFGVFYDRGAQVEVCHSIAEFVACQSPASNSSKMIINGLFEKYRLGVDEIIVRPTLETFLEALLNGQIGARLLFSEPTHKWLISYVRSKAQKAKVPLPSNVGRAFDQFASNPTNDPIPSPDDGLAVLVVVVQD